MRKKYGLVILVITLLLPSSIAFADAFTQHTGMHFYAGGWDSVNGNDGTHWTRYSVNAQVDVTAYIKVLSNAVEGNSGLGSAYISSNHLAGPYDTHRHSYNVPFKSKLKLLLLKF